MSPRIAEAIIALGIAYGFRGFGDAILHRRSASLRHFNLAFLTGASAAALVLFPLSLLAGPYTLTIMTLAVWVSVIAQLALRVVLRLRRSGSLTPAAERGEAPQRPKRDWVVTVWSVVLAALIVQFAVQNLRVSYLWDGYQIWATKALLLHERGALTRDFLVPGEPERLTDYPPLVPLYHAIAAKTLGRFEWNSLKPNYLVFYLSLLISVYSLAAALMNRRLAIAATALLAMVPEVSTRWVVGGYADMPQSALVAGAAAAVFSPARAAWTHPFPWVVGGILMVKSEGAILAAIACAAMFGFWAAGGPRELREALRVHAAGIAVIGAGFALRLGYLEWVASGDSMYGPIDGPHLVRAVSLAQEVIRLCISHMLNIGNWGALWPAFVAGAIVLLARGSRAEKCLCLGAVAAVAADVAIFTVTNWNPVSLHIDQAFSRLLVHIAPIAMVIAVSAWARVARIAT